MNVPIACRLTPTAARTQLGEWSTLLASSVAAAERLSPTELALRLQPGLAQLDALVRLAQREKACCPFFDFVIRIEADAVTLQVTVPAEAGPVLDSFAGHAL